MVPKNNKKKRKNKKQRAIAKNNLLNLNQPSRTKELVDENTTERLTPSRKDWTQVKELFEGSTETSTVTVTSAELTEVTTQSNKQSVKKLNVIKKILTLLDVNDKRFLTVLETILALHDHTASEKELRMRLVDLLLNNLGTSDGEEVKALADACDSTLLLHQVLDKYIVDGSSLVVNEDVQLGRGGFGIVYLGKLRKSDGSWIKVAVKKTLDNKHQKTCIEEAKIMAQFNHKNVMKILAYQKFPSKIVMEYMEWKNLVHALQDCYFTDGELLHALHDVASGMEYIASKNYVHRDLACKNVFVNSKRECKVGDFGLSKRVDDDSGYFEDKKYTLVTYNTAPEAKIMQQFSTKSDVWSMGILMWELYHIASTPNEISLMQELLLLEMFEMTGRLAQPQRCPWNMYLYIWKIVLHPDPRQRPTFAAMKNTLSNFRTSTHCIPQHSPDMDCNCS